MSPVPEPMQGGRGNPRDGDEDGISPPAGLMMGPPMSSSDEEQDQVESDDPNLSGYQPLPQDFDDEQEDTAIDYSSLSGLMAALNSHGPSVVEDVTGEENTRDNNHEVNVDTTGQETSRPMSSQATEFVQQGQRHCEEFQEQAAIWNSPQMDRLSLDGNKVEEIKSVMASFTLPQSAIPPWAQNISDEDWKNQIAGLLSRQESQ